MTSQQTTRVSFGLAALTAVGMTLPAGAQLSSLGQQLWHQSIAGVAGSAEAEDHFGNALATGDFDGDGYEDQAIGVPSEDIGTVTGAGAVQVLYGTAAGLTAAGNQLWHQDSPGVSGAAEDGDKFGGALAAGDFDGDGYDDLAIGVVGEDIDGFPNAGAVNVLYGGAGGLAVPGNQFWHQDVGGVLDQSEPSDFFGSSLAAGDFDGDGYDDLAVGVQGEELGGFLRAGAVQVLYGGVGGLSVTGNQFWHQDSPNIPEAPEAFDVFGAALTVGNFDDDRYDDLAIGVPGESVNAISQAGAVHVLYGGTGGLSAAGTHYWHQDSLNIRDAAETPDRFGSALAAGDFDGDEYDDLAIGVVQESIPSAAGTGAVQVLYGGATGVSSRGNQFWHQDSSGVSGVAEDGDQFGFALAAGDLDQNGFDDLAIGVPGKDIGTAAAAGAVSVLYGVSFGLSATGNQVWHQNSPGLSGVAEDGDQFGFALAAGDLDQNGFDDLAIGVPTEDIGAISDAGVVNVLYGVQAAVFADGFESGDVSAWSQTVP